MKNLLMIICFSIIFSSCKNEEKRKVYNAEKIELQEIITSKYELSKPTKNIKGVLVLFGGYPEKAIDIKKEFPILEIAKKNGLAVVFMNFNQKLWLEESQKKSLSDELEAIFKENKLPYKNINIGGFSSGGNVTLLISDFLIQQKSVIAPRGVFVIDSPIDLVALYKSSEKNIKRNFSEPSVQESTWLIKTLGNQFGNPHTDVSRFKKFSIFTSETNNIDNLKNLKNTKIRLYTEPDTLWWKVNRMADLDQMNAYYLKKLSESLLKSGFTQVEYIPTKNKGYRANGERHPHSWAIVDKIDLMKWLKN
jgi:hypothetical protein